MKYVVILGDGMADYRQPSLGGKTPLMLANKPYIDGLAKNSEVGLCRTSWCLCMEPGYARLGRNFLEPCFHQDGGW